MTTPDWDGIANGPEWSPTQKREQRAGQLPPEDLERRAAELSIQDVHKQITEAWHFGFIDLRCSNGDVEVSMTAEQAWAYQQAHTTE